jgi:hypothetical protein
MHRVTRLQFQRLPAEAQRAALWRLAWSGLNPEQIADRIGWTSEQVRRCMHEELAPVQPSWARRSGQIAANA